jgi:hypothetical protein
LPIFARAGKPDDRRPQTQVCVCEAVARDADPIDLPRRNSPIDIDRNLSACLHPARASRVRIIIRICTDTKINAVVKP